MYRILLTAPPMINRLKHYTSKYFHIEVPADFQQTLSEEQLTRILSEYDGWIIGDDNVTKSVLKAGISGRLKVVIKWGIGVDSIDLEAIKKLRLPFTNTPRMFSHEVADVAIGYLIMLARQLHRIDMEVRKGNWYKPAGISLEDKKVAIIGYGNIGKCLKGKLNAFGMTVTFFDPFLLPQNTLKETLEDAQFIIITCALTATSRYLINLDTIKLAPRGVFIINVARGPIVKEADLITGLESGHVAGAALDVFEQEPVQNESDLKKYNVIFGSHNSSNTVEAVDRVSNRVLEFLEKYLVYI